MILLIMISQIMIAVKKYRINNVDSDFNQDDNGHTAP